MARNGRPMLRVSLLVVLLAVTAADQARAGGGGRCGGVVIVERSGPVTIIRNYPRPCGSEVVVIPPPARFAAPPRHLKPEFGRVTRDFHRHLRLPPPHRRLERHLTVPPLSVRPLFPPPRHHLGLRRDWR